MVVTSYKIVQSLISLCSAACITHPYKTTKERSRNSGPKLLHIIARSRGVGTPGNSWWGCAARFSKSWNYFRPKNVIFHTLFQNLRKFYIRKGSAPRSNPLLFIYHFLREKVPLSHTFHLKMIPLSHTYVRTYVVSLFLNPGNEVNVSRVWTIYARYFN